MEIQKFKNLLLSSLIIIILVGTTALCSFATEYKSVKKEGANFRSGPGINYEILFQMPQNYPLKVEAKSGDWLKVEDYEGDKGWILESLVSSVPYVIMREKARIHKKRSLFSDVIAVVEKDVILKKEKEHGLWVQVSDPEISAGWMPGYRMWPEVDRFTRNEKNEMFFENKKIEKRDLFQ